MYTLLSADISNYKAGGRKNDIKKITQIINIIKL